MISKYLAGLANSSVTLKERDILAKVIEQLFIDLEMGHSCSKVKDILATVNCEKSSFDNLLLKSGLVKVYDTANELIYRVENKPLKHTSPVSLLKLPTFELLSITKYLQYEISIAWRINQLKNSVAKDFSSNIDYINGIKHLEELQNTAELPNKEQLAALKNSLAHKISIITGGPGTGKTTTIVFLLWLFYKTYGSSIKIKLAAPTGKAAKRVQESIQSGLSNLVDKLDATELLVNFADSKNNFLTLHRLLGYRHHDIHFRHNENNPLDLDILIIDESSMVSLPMFSKLLQTIDVHKIKHIIFLGDKNQLSSVEEGYVFATLVDQSFENRYLSRGNDLFAELYKGIVSELIVSNRSNSDIGKLASAILQQDAQTALELLKTSTITQLQKLDLNKIISTYVNSDDKTISYLDFIRVFNTHKNDFMYTDAARQECTVVDPHFHRDDIQRTEERGQSTDETDCHPGPDSGSTNKERENCSVAEAYETLYREYIRQVILCLTNVGVYGTDNLNTLVEKNIKESLYTLDEWYVGRAIIILENNYTYGLSNGDIGFCLKKNDDVVIVFAGGLEIIPEALPKYKPAYAITIHKAQGSEYNNVNIVLGDTIEFSRQNNLLSREVIYTAVTRAKAGVTIYGDEEVLTKAINCVTVRNTGLKYLL